MLNLGTDVFNSGGIRFSDGNWRVGGSEGMESTEVVNMMTRVVAARISEYMLTSRATNCHR